MFQKDRVCKMQNLWCMIYGYSRTTRTWNFFYTTNSNVIYADTAVIELKN